MSNFSYAPTRESLIDNLQAAHERISELEAQLRESFERASVIALEQRCERGTPWGLGLRIYCEEDSRGRTPSRGKIMSEKLVLLQRFNLGIDTNPRPTPNMIRQWNELDRVSKAVYNKPYDALAGEQKTEVHLAIKDPKHKLHELADSVLNPKPEAPATPGPEETEFHEMLSTQLQLRPDASN